MASTAAPGNRVKYIDGFRGLAVLMVVVFHAWQGLDPARTHHPWTYKPGSILGTLASYGHLGVSLFFVLSGFCLATPLLRRRKRGDADWFRPSQFFARRCVRILPPYYVALLVCVALDDFLIRVQGPLLQTPHDPGASNIAAHFFLIHNLISQYAFSINGAFWTLGLEFQWYILFPAVLIALLLMPRASLLLFTIIAVAGLIVTTGYFELSPLPRLLEFACGILAAEWVVAERRVPMRLLLPMLLAPFPVLLIEHYWHRVIIGPSSPAPEFGIAFAALILLAGQTEWLNRVFSMRALERLGLASYSVYLMHLPVVEAVDGLLTARHWPLYAAWAGSAMAGVAAGTAFFLLVERYVIRPDIAQALGSPLQRWFRPIDTIYTSIRRRAAQMLGMTWDLPPAPMAGHEARRL